MYQLLSSPVQEAGVTSQDFFVHILDIRQKVFFAFREAGSDLKYDPRLIQCMFLHSLLTGLQNYSIMKIKPCLQNTQVEDEELSEKLNAAVSNETEWMQKLGSHHGQLTYWTPTQLVVRVTNHNGSGASVEDKTPKEPPKVNLSKLENWKGNWPLSRKVWNNKVVITPTYSITLQNKGGPALKGAGAAKDKGGVSIATIASLVVMLATSVTNA